MLAGLCTILLTLPLNAYMAVRQSKLAKKCAVATDKRMNSIGGIVEGIRAVKTMAWEIPFLRRVSAAREEELLLINKLQIFRAYANVIAQSTPAFVALASVLCYVMVAGEDLEPATMFTALALFASIKDPLARVPRFALTP